MEFEENLELQDLYYYDDIIYNTGSPDDLRSLNSWLEYYREMVDSLSALISRLNIQDQFEENPQAAEIIVDMHRRYKDIADTIAEAIARTEARNERTRQQLQAVATASEDFKDVKRPQFPSAGDPASSRTLPSNDDTDSDHAESSASLTYDDLGELELTTSELAKILSMSASLVRRRAVEASKLVGWDANSKFPLAVDALVLYDNDKVKKRFAAAKPSKGGGKDKGWLFREIIPKLEDLPKPEA